MDTTKYQLEVATELGIMPSHLSEYKTAQRAIPIHNLIKLCHYFQTPPTEILGFTEINTTSELIDQ